MAEPYDIERWKKQYDDDRFRGLLGRASTILAFKETPSENVFTFHLGKDGLSFQRSMSDSIDGSMTCGHVRWFDDGHMIDEILIENVAFLRPESSRSSPGTGEGADCPTGPGTGMGGVSGRPVSLFETLLRIEPHRRVRFSHCYFEYWEIPADLGHDMCFDSCIFKARVEFSGRLTSDVTFEKCIIFSDLTIRSCQGLGTFRIGSTYHHGIQVNDAVMAALILTDHTVISGTVKICNSKFRRTLSFDDVCQLKPQMCSDDKEEGPFSIRSCVVGDALSLIETELESLRCIDSTIESMEIKKLRSRKAIDFSCSHFNGGITMMKAEAETLSMKRTYVYRNMMLSTDDCRLALANGCDLSNITVEGDVQLIGLETKELVLKEGRFGNLFMSGCDVKKADLHEITVDGKCSMTHSRFTEALDLAGSYFGDGLVLSDRDDEASTFSDLILNDITVNKEFRLSAARCADVIADGASFDEVDMTSTEVRGGLSLSGAVVNGDIDMNSIRVEEDVHFKGAEAQDLHMDSASFSNLDMAEARFSCIFLQDITASSMTLYHLRSKEVRLSLDDHSWLSGGSFEGMEVESCFIMGRMDFDFCPDFSSSRFEKGVLMTNVTLRDGIDMSKSIFGGNSEFDFTVLRGSNRINFSHASFQSNNGNVCIHVTESSGIAMLDLRALATNSQIHFSGFVFDSLREYGARRVAYRLFGHSHEVFRNLWCGSGSWRILMDQWAVLEQIYRTRNELDLQKDAYIWKRFCERRALKTANEPRGV